MAEEIKVDLVVDNEDGKAKLEDFATRLAAVSAAAAVVLDSLETPTQGGLFSQEAKSEVESYDSAVQGVGASAKAAVKELKEDPSKAEGGLIGDKTMERIQKTGDALDELGSRGRRARRRITAPPEGDPKKSFPDVVSGKLKDLGNTLSNFLPRQLKMLQRQFKMATRGTRSFTKGLSGMRKALISTGIGALVVALGELVANWDSITSALNKASARTNDLLDSSKEMAQAAKDQQEAIEGSTNQMLLMGKTEEDIAAMKEKALDDQILAQEMQLEYTRQQAREQQETIKRNHDIAMAFLGILQAPIIAVLGVVDAMTAAAADLGLVDKATTLAADLLSFEADLLGFDVDEAQAENEDRIAQAEAELNRLKEKRAANEVRKRKDREREKETERKAQEALAKQQEDFLNKLLEQEQNYGKSQEELEVMRLERSQAAEMQKAESLKLSQEEIERLRTQHELAMTELLEKQAKARAKTEEDERAHITNALKSELDRRLGQVRNQYAELIKLAEKYGMDTAELERKRDAELKEIRDQAAERELADSERLQEERIRGMQSFVGDIRSLYSEIGNMISANAEAEMVAAKLRKASDEDLKKIEKEAAEREKRMAVTMVLLSQAQSLASGIQGAAQAAAATGPAAPFALAGYIASIVGTIVAGFAQVKNIMNRANAAGIESGGGGGAGGFQRGRTSVLTPNLVTDLRNEDGVTEGRERQSFKAYVVASDIQGQNEDYGSIVQNASL